jgi:uncharacterized protein with ATP-grasp and redox domains
VVNDTLYYVGYETEGNPYISDNDGGHYVDLSVVDGDIEIDRCSVFFTVNGEPIRMQFLEIMDLKV